MAQDVGIGVDQHALGHIHADVRVDGPVVVGDLQDQRPHGQLHAVDVGHARVQAGQLQHPVHQRLLAQRVPLDDLEETAVALIFHLGLQDVGVPDDGRQRRPQLVGGCVGEVDLALVLLLQGMIRLQ